ncbi:MAG: hypothetical protein EOO89_22095, partial [Pedobacter sp.]
VEDLAQRRLSGSTAVLTHTNNEALLVQNLLQQKGIPARLIASQDGFSLKQLLELRCFGWYVHDGIHNDHGFITKEVWRNGRNRINQEFEKSATLTLVLEVIDTFEKATGERKYWAEYQAYLHEIRTEDFVFPDQNKVLVSTMHKAKGKEFDHVYLLLSNHTLKTESDKRVVYVAITRAKESLHIHTDQSYFQNMEVPQLSLQQNDMQYPEPNLLQLELGMSDVWLGFFKRESNQDGIKPLQAGQPLLIPSDPLTGLLDEVRSPVLKYSQKFKEKLQLFFHQGYQIDRAEVAYIVVWRCPDDGNSYRVVLGRIWISKEEN